MILIQLKYLWPATGVVYLETVTNYCRPTIMFGHFQMRMQFLFKSIIFNKFIDIIGRDASEKHK
jgi:hypothetical protein